MRYRKQGNAQIWNPCGGERRREIKEKEVEAGVEAEPELPLKAKLYPWVPGQW